ncbi:MAG: ceramidase domain-containing protein [Anaerolineales bacterium]|nr:ceramidase domain-containing protein [Anaerolineales bacterium]
MMWFVVSLIILLNYVTDSSWLAVIPTTAEVARAWEIMQPATCMPNNCFCEPVVSGFIRQPVNTWTNLAFILAGTLTAIVAVCDLSIHAPKQKRTNLMRSQWIYPAVYSYMAVLIGLGSMFYHSSLILYGQVADILSMYLLSTFMTLYNLSRAWKIKGWQFFWLYLAINLVLGYLSTTLPEYRRQIFVGILVTILLSEVVVRIQSNTRMNMPSFWAALGSLAVGCTAWILDITGAFCMPNSWLQLHALWHIGMASAIWFVYLYYRSEQPGLVQLQPVNKAASPEAEPC